MRELVAALVALVVAGCCPGTHPAPEPPAPGPPASALPAASAAPSASSRGPRPEVDAVAERADALLALAAKAEPTVTPALVALAKERNGEMVKLEYRLKTKASTMRKLNKELAKRPGLAPSDVRIDDALRYTMRVDDEPAGHYLEAVRGTLSELEKLGHQVQYVKNYWPRNDNYSGINSVLRDESGLLWELQFHTSQSFAIQSETRPHYEELRRLDTPVERKRELFDQMTERWNTVPVPEGVLLKGALHAKDQVRERKRP